MEHRDANIFMIYPIISQLKDFSLIITFYICYITDNTMPLHRCEDKIALTVFNQKYFNRSF